MQISYLVTPFLAWFFTGTLKFLINSIRFRKIDLNQIGYGSFPSNHSAIVSSMVVIIALREGIDTPAFGVAVTVAFIVMMDAVSLRRHVGKQASVINQLTRKMNMQKQLRERLGHNLFEVFFGFITGALTAWFVAIIFI